MRALVVALSAVALSACGSITLTDVRPCVGALVASPAVVDAKSALAAASATPACSTLTADLIHAALTQALAAKGR